jgi:hypothetical protein
MTDERLITLVKLYNRLSFYFCLVDDKKPIPDINENTTISELQEFLDILYTDVDKKKQEEKTKPKIKFLKD